MKKFFLLSLLLAGAVSAFAQDPVITDTTKMTNSMFGMNYYRVNYLYQSVAPDGVTPVTLSSAMVFPAKVFERTESTVVGDKEYGASGLLLHNRITMTRNIDAPTLAEDMAIEGIVAVMGPKSIMISPDGYGFGASADKPQAYLIADATARNSIDAVKAARKLLGQMGYTYGNLFCQMGYSQGGHSTMAVQRYIDTKGTDPDAIPHIDYTLCGAGPYDMVAMLDSLSLPGATYTYPCALALIAQGQIEGAGIDIKASDLLRSPLDTKCFDWLNSKALTTDELNDSIFAIIGGDVKNGVPVSDVLCTENFKSSVLAPFTKALEENSLVSGWKPNTTTQFYLYHSGADEVVAYYNTEHMVDFLKNEGGVGDDRLKVVKGYNSHVATASVFVLGAISELLTLEKKYKNGEYVPEEFSGSSITEIQISPRHTGWYTLQGQYLQAKPTAAGIYIHDGRKVVIGR